MKYIQIRSFFWSVFSGIRTEYREILRISPYSVRLRENTDQKKLRIGTLFTQWHFPNKGRIQDSTILSLHRKIHVRENQYSGIFLVVTPLIDCFSRNVWMGKLPRNAFQNDVTGFFLFIYFFFAKPCNSADTRNKILKSVYFTLIYGSVSKLHKINFQNAENWGAE